MPMLNAAEPLRRNTSGTSEYIANSDPANAAISRNPSAPAARPTFERSLSSNTAHCIPLMTAPMPPIAARTSEVDAPSSSALSCSTFDDA